jgi:hypothetical protein
MPDLSTDLAVDLATDLAVDLAGSADTPPYYADVLFHVDAEHGLVEGDPGRLASWFCRVSGAEMIANGTASEPAISTAFGGKAAINYESGDRMRVLPTDANFAAAISAIESGVFTLVTVGECRETGQTNRMFDFDSAAYVEGWVQNTGTLRLFTSGGSGVGTVAASTGFEVIGLGGDGGSNNYGYTASGRETLAGTTPVGADASRVYSFGNRWSGGNNVGDHAFTEWILYNRVLTADEWTEVRDYAVARWT